jgi:8-hydroxy-5-deazaflavin:NADPH oxidoreductase
MEIAIIGTGNVGSALARRWTAVGHRITLGTRDPQAEEVQALAREIGAAAADPRAAVEGAEIVVLAVPGTAAEEAVRSLGDLTDKVLVDCTNPVAPGMKLAVGHTTSAAERIAQAAPGARVVKAFSTTGAGNMLDPVYGNGQQRLAMFLCGDDADARASVGRLAEEIGFEAVDNGPLERARLLEPLAMVWITLAYAQGWGPDFGFALLRR